MLSDCGMIIVSWTEPAFDAFMKCGWSEDWGSVLGNYIICSIGAPSFVSVGLSVPWDLGMDRKCCVSAMQKGVRAAGFLGKWGEGACCCKVPGLPVAVCLHIWPIWLSLFKLSKSNSRASLSARPCRCCFTTRTGERSAHLRKVLFPPFPFPFKALGQAVWFLSGLCRAFKWGHSGSLINPVQLSLHPRLHIVLGLSPLPQCILQQLNICLKTDCQEVLAKPGFPSGCMDAVQHNIV